MLLAFPVSIIRKLNLDLRGTGGGYLMTQCDFIGTNLLDYLRSSASDFGEYVTESETYHTAEAMVGAAFGLGLFAGLILLIDRKDDRD